MQSRYYVLALVCVLGLASTAEAKKNKWQDVQETEQSSNLPICLDGDRRAFPSANNEQVLRWKESTENQYKDRALIDGVLVGVILDRRSHLHLEVNLANAGKAGDRRENIEIVYNKAFGEVAYSKPGQRVQACGDYITSNEQSGPYKPSPVGAIIHWVHKSNNLGKHDNGFLAIDGKVYGLEDEEGRQTRH